MKYPPEVLNAPGRPKPAPYEYSGEWVAWTKDRSTIIAHGKQVSEVREAAVAAGHPDCVLQKVPEANIIFIGAS